MPNADPVEGDASIGRYLARQRELRGISVPELSEQTKIPLRSLERLESGAFDRDADGFARGFVRTVAEALGLDPDEAVMRLMTEPPEDEPEARSAVPRGLVAAGLGLLAAALAVLAVWALGALLPAGDAGRAASSEIVYRTDAVRALAESSAAGAPAPGPEAASSPAPEAPRSAAEADASGAAD